MRQIIRRCAVGIALIVLPAGCGTVGNVVGAVTGGGGASDAAPATPSATGAPDAASQAAAFGGGAITCPAVQIRSGTQGLTRYAGGRDGDASALRHQFSIRRTARDCRFVDGQLFLRVGAAGRVIAGPAGGPGDYEAPVRIVVARGGVDPVYSRIAAARATISPGQGSGEFDVVASDIVITLEPGETVGNFQIFVGFDA